ncbi:hypothetical protein GE061_008769 [Apolygus lucorum]|uniref:Uncharacterized protein n=1 Tax=Apolygus lucorum TaxID=248454 RepID=A0A8S9WLG2_APOLU|nr:hypothetical protein GE061_008769 [Apolygus lucorum]
MEDEIVVKEEPMIGGEKNEVQVKEEVEIKQEALMGDEDVEEEVEKRWAVEDEAEGYPMIKREDGLTDPLGDESDVLEGSVGVQRSEAGPDMEDEIVVKEEPMIGGEENEVQVKEEVEIKQEALMGDEDVEEEVGKRWAGEDEAEGYLMIKREDGLTDPLGGESDVLEGSVGVQRSEAGPGWGEMLTPLILLMNFHVSFSPSRLPARSKSFSRLRAFPSPLSVS